MSFSRAGWILASAISVLTIVILGPLAVTTSILSNSSFSSNQIIAYNLAEEAMEFIINKRDSNVFEGNNWDNSFGSCIPLPNGCRIDVTTQDIQGCGANCEKIHRNSASGLYSHNTSDPVTIFERRVFIEGGGGDEKRVKVTLSWSEKNGSARSG